MLAISPMLYKISLCLMLYVFMLLILFIRFSRQEYCSGLPFLSPVNHILSELSNMTQPSWVVLDGMAHSFIELDKTVIQWSVWLAFCNCDFYSVCPLGLGWIRIRGSWELPDGRDWLWGNLDLVLMGGAVLSKSLIPFSVDGWSFVPSL